MLFFYSVTFLLSFAWAAIDSNGWGSEDILRTAPNGACNSSSPMCSGFRFQSAALALGPHCRAASLVYAEAMQSAQRLGDPARVVGGIMAAHAAFCASDCVYAMRVLVEEGLLCCLSAVTPVAGIVHTVQSCQRAEGPLPYPMVMAGLSLGAPAACMGNNFNNDLPQVANSSTNCFEAAGCEVVTEKARPSCMFKVPNENAMMERICHPASALFTKFPAGGMLSEPFTSFSASYITYCNTMDGKLCALELGDTAYTAPLLLSQGQLTALCNNPTKLGCYRARWAAIAEGTRRGITERLTQNDLKDETVSISLTYPESLEMAVESMCAKTGTSYCSPELTAAAFAIASRCTGCQKSLACDDNLLGLLSTIKSHYLNTCCAATAAQSLFYMAAAPPDQPISGSVAMQLTTLMGTLGKVPPLSPNITSAVAEATIANMQKKSPFLAFMDPRCGSVSPSSTACSTSTSGKASLSLDLAVSYAAVEAVTGLKAQLGHALAVDVAVLVGSTSRAVTVALAADAEHQVYIGGGLTSGIKAIITVSCEDDAAAARIQQRFAARLSTNSALFLTMALTLRNQCEMCFQGFTPLLWSNLSQSVDGTAKSFEAVRSARQKTAAVTDDASTYSWSTSLLILFCCSFYTFLFI